LGRPGPSGAVYQFAPDWKKEHVLDHLGQASGILQADGYKGYAKLYATDLEGKSQFREAACWPCDRRRPGPRSTPSGTGPESS
jgi:transposase